MFRKLINEGLQLSGRWLHRRENQVGIQTKHRKPIRCPAVLYVVTTVLCMATGGDVLPVSPHLPARHRTASHSPGMTNRRLSFGTRSKHTSYRNCCSLCARFVSQQRSIGYQELCSNSSGRMSIVTSYQEEQEAAAEVLFNSVKSRTGLESPYDENNPLMRSAGVRSSVPPIL